MANKVNLQLAKNLKDLRKKSNKKQFEMALLFNMKQQNYSKMETGKTHFNDDIVSKICGVFQINAEEFYYGLNYKKSEVLSIDSDINILKNHYETLLLESELRNVNLEQRHRNYIPLQETSPEDAPRIYVII